MEHEPKVVTTITVPRRIWQLLRQLAEQRSVEVGGRPSVSGIISQLAERAGREDAPRIEPRAE